MNELAQAKKRAKKTARGQEYNPKAVLGSLRRDCVELDLTSGGLVRVPHAPPPVSFDLYVGGMI